MSNYKHIWNGKIGSLTKETESLNNKKYARYKEASNQNFRNEKTEKIKCFKLKNTIIVMKL